MLPAGVAHAESVTTYSGDFVLSDEKSCSTCKSVGACNKEILKINSAESVAVVNVETLLAKFNPAMLQSLRNCDYFMCDAEDGYAARKVAFCDLTCTREEYLEPGISTRYPEGKRRYAVGQMKSMAGFLSSNELLQQYLMTSTSRRFILAVRIPEPSHTDAAMSAMRGFMRTPSSEAGVLASRQQLANMYFDYVEVRYPGVLNW